MQQSHQNFTLCMLSAASNNVQLQQKTSAIVFYTKVDASVKIHNLDYCI